ncbi:penicillin-binding protein 1C [Hafnia paralvei]|uniref:peptidoglycan glycosyltransferase PbpC n=1 Tax=Hafnia paralvei TaxID=546367 RepID=UPI001034F35A|nr:peptidoglycan glycosyltransferase PbpC [Hafnia paralvei]TBL99164.1 penicillin-binding protein 1C [Hafnia paralvei]
MILLKRLCKWCGIIALLALLVVAGLWVADKVWPLPIKDVQVARIVVAADGSPLWRFADGQGVWRYPVNVEQVSPYYLQALLTYEDRWFYQHPGINPFALARAAWQDVSHGRIISGGSTLSMQVARLLDPHSRTFGGKVRQVWRTVQLEWHLSKTQILELYLNRAPFGGTLQGIGAASWAYLGKPPDELTRSEAALLAVLPQAPSRLRPDRYPIRAQAARNKVLDRLAEYQVWEQQQVDDIKQEPVWLAPRQMPQSAPLLARRMIQTYPLQGVINTTIDASLQRQLETLAKGWGSRLPAKTSVGVLIVDHTDMQVKAYLGSLDFADNSRFGHVDMVRAWRSPGSTLKPFLYGLALDDGLIHNESLLQDVPRRFGDYRPGNFDTGFHGAVSASEALTRSLNLPAVQLLEAYGPKRFAAQLRNAGLELSFPDHAEPNLALILGGAGARLEQLVSTYSALARQGESADLRYVVGQKIYNRPLMSPGAAWIIRRTLAGQARPEPDDSLSAVVPLAWKTGTSFGYRDAWAIGVNARYTIGVWVGRPDGTPVAGQFGYATAVPLLFQLNNLLLNNPTLRGNGWPTDPRPSTVTRAMICWPSGQPSNEQDGNCRQRRSTWVLDGTTPPTLVAPEQESSQGIWRHEWLDDEGKRVAPECHGSVEKLLALWPLPLEPWLPEAEKRANRIPAASKVCPPPVETLSAPLVLIGLSDGSILRRPPGKTDIDLRLTTQGGEGQRWWFLNGELVSQEASLFYRFTKVGRYQLTVMDGGGQIASVDFQVE